MVKEQNVQIYLKGENKTNSVLGYEYIGYEKVEVTFKSGKSFLYNSENVQIIESVLNFTKPSACFEYLKCIANEYGLKAETEKGKILNILAHNYSKIGFVWPDSVLGAFLSANYPKSEPSSKAGIIYPFGFNVSQKEAVEKALTNQLSIIEGPPGTGKTQTILNIIANAVMRGESVAVVSSNNSATKNVFDKLQKKSVEFIAAYLGNTSNKVDFINAQKPLPDMTNWRLSSEEISSIKNSLVQKHKHLEEKLLQQQQLSALDLELNNLETEEQYFLKYADKLDNLSKRKNIPKLATSEKALEMWMLCECYEEPPSIKSFIGFVKYIIRYLKFLYRDGLLIHKLIKHKNSPDFLIAVFQQQFYELKALELKQSISKLAHELALFDLDSKMKEYTEISMQVFKACIAQQYEKRERPNYTIEDLRKDSETFIQDYPVILSTTYSLRSSLASAIMYDYVIVDESSQVDLCTGALALSCARKAVIVGDLKQLPHVVDSKKAKGLDNIFAEFKLPDFYNYKNHSLLSSLVAMFPKSPRTLLREHYRCHPKIIDFCNKKFYAGQLVILSEYKKGYDPLVLYKTIEGNHERNRMNQRQIDVIQKEVIPQQALNTMDDSVGIVTPYRNQTNALQRAFAGLRIMADTVDKFQGQEKEVVILSTVDNEISEFADNSNRLNVAVSRAIKQLIVVVNDSDSLKDTNIGDLVQYIEYNNYSIVESKVNSVFDYLYRSYTERRRKFLLKHKRISEFDSENLMYALLTDVLKERDMLYLEVSTHVPLKMIIRDMEMLSPLERRYAMNISTHFDFLIYDTIRKAPKFAIEVDGTEFHIEGSRQSERDAMKNEICKKYGLPLFRFKTDGSGEREQLIAALSSP